MCIIKRPSRHHGQRGVGMVEVLVAMLILAVGVLGFSVLQVRAVLAMSEATNRSQALLILRGLAEEIRANSTAQSSYPADVSALSSTLGTAPTSCVNTACTPAAMALWDSYQAALAASNLGMHINMTLPTGAVKACPGDTTRQCLLAAWGKTNPTFNSGATDCMQTTGNYVLGSTCVMLEVY